MTTPFTPPSFQADEADAEIIDATADSAGFFTELGTTGLNRAAGYVDEEFLPQLKGRKAVQIYREMGDNDPIVGAMMFAIQELVKDVDWQVMPAGNNAEDAAAAKLIETAKDDMTHSWAEFVAEALTSIQYGWAWHEPVFKRRMGPWQKDSRQKSLYSDGLIGWRKIPIRAQETLLRWSFDESGEVNGMFQLAPPDYGVRALPLERSLLFRHGVHKNNPEGRSMLRNAYRPWYYKKRLEEFESIGVERDLAGLPMVKVPSSYLKAKAGSDQAKMVEAFKKLVRSIRRNEQEGLVFPTAFDSDTRQPLFEFELLGSGGARQFSTDTLIQRYEQRILMTVLADWILVGHESTGTYNMHVDKRGAFKTAINGTVRAIADVINRDAIPKLFAINGWRPQRLPKFVPSDIDAPDLTQLSQFLGATAQLGFVWGPDADLEQWMRRAAGMPALAPDDYRKRRKEARQEESTRFAEEQLRYLATRSQLAQAIAQQKTQAAGIPEPEETQGMAATQQQNQMQQDQRQMAQDQQGAANQQAAHNERRTEEAHQMSMAQQAAGPSSAGGGGGGSGDAAPVRKRAPRRVDARPAARLIRTRG